VATGRTTHPIGDPDLIGQLGGAAWSPDSRWLIMSGGGLKFRGRVVRAADGELFELDLPVGRLVAVLPTHAPGG
jgi:hypothetical protein